MFFSYWSYHIIFFCSYCWCTGRFLGMRIACINSRFFCTSVTCIYRSFTRYWSFRLRSYNCIIFRFYHWRFCIFMSFLGSYRCSWLFCMSIFTHWSIFMLFFGSRCWVGRSYFSMSILSYWGYRLFCMSVFRCRRISFYFWLRCYRFIFFRCYCWSDWMFSAIWCTTFRSYCWSPFRRYWCSRLTFISHRMFC